MQLQKVIYQLVCLTRNKLRKEHLLKTFTLHRSDLILDSECGCRRLPNLMVHPTSTCGLLSTARGPAQKLLSYSFFLGNNKNQNTTALCELTRWVRTFLMFNELGRYCTKTLDLDRQEDFVWNWCYLHLGNIIIFHHPPQEMIENLSHGQLIVVYHVNDWSSTGFYLLTIFYILGSQRTNSHVLNWSICYIILLRAD